MAAARLETSSLLAQFGNVHVTAGRMADLPKNESTEAFCRCPAVVMDCGAASIGGRPDHYQH